MSANLLLRHQTWFVRYAVPRDQVAAYGRRHVVRTLKTHDKRVAAERMHGVVVQLQREIAAQIAERPQIAVNDPEYVRAEAARIRALLEADLITPHAATHFLDATLEQHLDSYPAKNRDPETGYPYVPQEVEETLQAAMTYGLNLKFKPLKDWIADHVEAKAEASQAGTINEKRRLLNHLARHLGTLRDPRTIERPELSKYVEEVLKKTGNSPKTLKTKITHISHFFNWLVDSGVIDQSPATRLTRLIQTSKRGNSAGRRRKWDDHELDVLLSDETLSPRVRACALIALYSGMRLGEICELKADHVDHESVEVHEGKTEAALRRVPLHPITAPLLAALKASTKDGYVIPDLLRGGKDNSRGHYASKNFGTWKEDRFPGEKGLVFHSLRHTFTTATENNGAPKDTVKLILGHERGDITFGLYSKGPHWSRCAEVVHAISYGEKIDAKSRDLAMRLPALIARERPSRPRGRSIKS